MTHLKMKTIHEKISATDLENDLSPGRWVEENAFVVSTPIIVHLIKKN
jgi:hypothetical protein